jgi:hypothetical protein
MVRVILSKQDNIKDQIELKIDVYDTALSHKWQKLLQQAIRDKMVIKKHVSHHGWIMDQSRTLKHIVEELNHRVQKLNEYDFTKRAWELQNGSIKKDFKIDLDLSVGNLIDGKDFNTDVVNELHDKFVQLEGAKDLDNLDIVSPYFDIAPPDIRWHISKLNNLAHELFHWGEEYKRWNRVNWINPEIHVNYYGKLFDEYTSEDDDNFIIGHKFGRVWISDPTVGKLYWDAFSDRDDHIHNDELFSPTHIVPDFKMYFGCATTVEEDKMWITQYHKWLYDRDLREHEPALTRVGKPVVGNIDFKPFGTQQQMAVDKILNGYNNIYAIIIDKYKATYEWTTSQEEIDIQQHA